MPWLSLHLSSCWSLYSLVTSCFLPLSFLERDFRKRLRKFCHRVYAPTYACWILIPLISALNSSPLTRRAYCLAEVVTGKPSRWLQRPASSWTDYCAGWIGLAFCWSTRCLKGFIEGRARIEVGVKYSKRFTIGHIDVQASLKRFTEGHAWFTFKLVWSVPLKDITDVEMGVKTFDWRTWQTLK